jgi:hypothetical protein
MSEEKIERTVAKRYDIKSREETTSKDTLTVSPTRTTVPADYVKVMMDDECQLCTFTFFKKHVNPKQTEEGILCDSVEDELFLEVKVPYKSAIALGLYMEATFRKMQETKGDGFTYRRFGPGTFSPSI